MATALRRTTIVGRSIKTYSCAICYTLQHFKFSISEQLLTKHELQKKQQDYYRHGPIRTKSTRLAIALSPTVDDIWDQINESNSIDETVFWCAMKRSIQLGSSEDLSSFMDFLLDPECIETTTLKGPNIHHWILLFNGLHKLNDLESAIEWLNIMLMGDIQPNTFIFNKLIGLCCKKNDIERGLKFYEWIKKLDIEYDKYTYAEMIQLYTSNDQMDEAQSIIELAKTNGILSTIHYNYFLRGLSLQQRQNDDNKPIKGLQRWLSSEFDKEMIESLPIVMNNLYDQMLEKDHIEPDIMSYEHLLSILSYYGNSSLCLYYFKELTNTYNLRPNVQIFNSLISSYCNEISLFNENEENRNDPLYFEKQYRLMEDNIDKIFQIYDNCKQLLIAPNIDTMKLMFHAMNARIMLSHSKFGAEDTSSSDIDSDELHHNEYSVEFNRELLNTLENEDIINYDIHIDKEMIYHIMNCHILIGLWENIDPSEQPDMRPWLQEYHKLCQQCQVPPHWKNNSCISLTDIPKSMYEDQSATYIAYVFEYEMDKLRSLDQLRIELPRHLLDDDLDGTKLDDLQKEMEGWLEQDLSDAKVEDYCISFVLTDCKDKLIDTFN